MKKTKREINLFNAWKKSLEIANIKFDENDYWKNADLITRNCVSKYSMDFYIERYSFLFDSNLVEKIYVKNVEYINSNRTNPYDPHEVSKKENITLDDAIRLVEERKRKTSGSLETFISRHGIVEGNRKYKEFAKKCVNSLDKFISLYGTELGKIKYEKYLQEKSTSLEKHIERYGIEEGNRRYIEMINKRKHAYSLEGHIEKYGANGKSIYESVKQKKGDGVTLEGLMKIHGDIEGRRRYQESRLKKSRNSTLTGFIEKYGEEDGRKRFELKKIKISPIYQELRKKYSDETATKLYLAGKSRKYEAAKEKVRADMLTIYFKSKSKGPVSKQSKLIFDTISEILNISLEYGKKNSEIKIFDERNACFYYYDCYHRETNSIIEYHGVAFHPKEGDYNWMSPYGADYNTIREKDVRKRQVAVENGFNFVEIWSDENLYETIEKVKRILYENKDSKN